MVKEQQVQYTQSVCLGLSRGGGGKGGGGGVGNAGPVQ